MTTKEERLAALDRAVDLAGGIVRFARAMSVTHQAVYNWRKRGWVPLERALAIETLYRLPHVQLIEPGLAQQLRSASGNDLI